MRTQILAFTGLVLFSVIGWAQPPSEPPHLGAQQAVPSPPGPSLPGGQVGYRPHPHGPPHPGEHGWYPPPPAHTRIKMDDGPNGPKIDVDCGDRATLQECARVALQLMEATSSGGSLKPRQPAQP